MLTVIVFAVVFASQIYLLSVHLPRKLTARRAAESPEWQQALQTSRFYAPANIALAVAGAILLSAFLFTDALAAMTPALLAIGGYFFLQMAPLAIVAGPVLARSPATANAADVSRPARLADFVSPLLMGLAVALAVGYLATQSALWDGTWDKRMLKVPIFAAVQLFLVGNLTWQLAATRRAAEADRAEGIQALASMAPMFTLLSIGISGYYFGKDILFALEVQALRPVMMSAFLQLLALLAIHHVFHCAVSSSDTPRSTKAPAVTGWPRSGLLRCHRARLSRWT
ncbi:MAG: hypothetical protein OES32_08080 [Acidobacteriota bacterium]|nr:hypothetical protein [Acidobacteriota bacterium]